jgi:RNA polymerase primary sigma factor
VSVNNYLRDVNRYPMATIEEEVQLAQTIRRGGKEGECAKKRLIEANLRFVVTVANQYHQHSMDLADLISEGNIGLIKAANRFDDTRGFRFVSYAVWWIRQAILQAVSEQGQTIRMPLNQQGLRQMYNLLLNETMQTEQRKPTTEEFAAFADIDVKKAEATINGFLSMTSMDAPIGEDSDMTFGDYLTSGSNSDQLVERESMVNDIHKVLSLLLTDKELTIIYRTYGLNGPEESLDAVGTDMGLSRERVRQIREKAFQKIRQSAHKNQIAQYLG